MTGITSSHSLKISPERIGMASDSSISSPSLRAPSTEAERSSPSTGFTSYDEEEDDNLYAAGAGSSAKPFSSGLRTMSRNEPCHDPRATSESLWKKSSKASEVSGASGRWKIPFARTNATPSSSKPPYSPWRNVTEDDDGSFVETTSAHAAHALAQYWNDVKRLGDANGKGKARATEDQNGFAEQYVVVARLDNGKKIYRIRPRSRPVAEEHFPSSDKRRSLLKVPGNPSIRLTRSIPNLREPSSSTTSQSQLLPISRDQDGFYRPDVASHSSARLQLPFESSHHLLPGSGLAADTRHRKSTLHGASSIPNLKSHRDADVFGKLLGWGYSNGRSYAAEAADAAECPVAQSATDSIQKQARIKHEDRPNALRTPVTSTFAESGRDTARRVRDGGLPGETTPKDKSSPFGAGVRLPSSPRLRRKKSFNRRLEIQSNSPNAKQEPQTFNGDSDLVEALEVQEEITAPGTFRSLRETASSETIRNAFQPQPFSTTQDASPHAGAAEDTPISERPDPFPSAQQKSAFDTSIFDIFQDLEQSESESAVPSTSVSRDSLNVDSALYKRHERGLSTASISSTLSLVSASSAASNKEAAHSITVTATPKDDPRFVIWGLKAPVDRLLPQKIKSETALPTLPSPTTAASAVAGQAKSSSTSRRWSSSRSRSSIPTVEGSPTAYSPSFDQQSQPQRLLMAATVERWVAEMTSQLNPDLRTDFFLTYRSFLSPTALLDLLLCRFEWALQGGEAPEDIAGRRIVRVRTSVVIRHWLLNYFQEDFVPDRSLRLTLTNWLNKMAKDTRLRANPTDLRLIKSLKKVVKQLKANYATIGPALVLQTLVNPMKAGEADVSRNRASTFSSMHSLQPLQEETGSHSVSSASRPLKQANAMSTHLERKDMRTSSSEDDVDLDIDLRSGGGYDSDEHPSIPQVFPISPPRPRNTSPKVSTRSPRHRDRSPQLISPLPNMPESNRISRYLSSTVGSIGKLKRIMKQREAPRGSVIYPPSQSTAVDPIHSLNNGLSQSLGRNEHHGVSNAGLGLADSRASNADISHSTHQHAQEGNEFVAHLTETSAQAGLAPPVEISGGPIIQLDDYDSSDDDSDSNDGNQVIKTLRRLPAARDLRSGKAGNGPGMLHRHSFDSVSSYATRRMPSFIAEPVRIPSFATYDSSATSADVDGAGAEEGVVPFFVPPVDSDDEEPGDVEAALRRLEGQVDQEKQISNAKKVEQYLKLSEEAKNNGGYLYEGGYREEDLADDGDDEISMSSRNSIALEQEAPTEPFNDELPLAAPASITLEQIPASTTNTNASTLTPSRVQFPSPEAEDSQRLSVVEKRVKRKSSVRRFFTNSRTSIAAAPAAPPSQPAPVPSSKPALPPEHRSFLMQHRTEILAQHFCIIEKDLLEKVTWQELVSGSWAERSHVGEVTDWSVYIKQRARAKAELQRTSAASADSSSSLAKSSNVQVIIQRFNLMCNWIASEIVLTPQFSERAALIAKIIRLAFKCYRMYNFQTLTQLIHGLQSPHIERLKKTWSKVPAFELRLFTQLKYFCSHLRNFKLLRDASEAIAQSWGPPGQSPDMTRPELAGIPGIIPFFGLILRDLAISSELPTFLDPSSPRAPAVLQPGSQILASYAEPQAFSELRPLPAHLPLHPLINVHKYRTIAGVIQKVMSFKEVARNYPYEPELAVYRKCLGLACLPLHLIQQLSTVCEK